MIKLHKDASAPLILQMRGVAHNVEVCRQVDDGKEPIFNNAIYRDKSVKIKLKKIQNGKCCYCETNIEPADYGHIDHFRPKKAWLQDRNSAISRPGYYWLAYKWDNLLLACSQCNITKSCLFPLIDPTVRAASPSDNLGDEEPIFINAYEEDPEDFVFYLEEIVKAKHENKRGKDSIFYLQLNDRSALLEDRRTTLESYKLLLEIRTNFLNGNNALVLRTGRAIQNMEVGKYSYMLKCYKRSLP
jgi:uncharacterized protein (TIGR02646 family)